jgi:ubiquinone/menaquinone biosynthesis C-methylase UbiE
MNHADHLRLIRKGVPGPGGIWAELGSGRGAFTLALAELVGQAGLIYSIDQNAAVLNEQKIAVERHFGDQKPEMHYWRADFTQRLELPALDGVLMANSLHFHKEKLAVLKEIYAYLRPGGCMILVEYNADRGNRWVPYPISFNTWRSLVLAPGFKNTRLLAKVPSSFMGEIYSAVSIK